MSLEWLPPPLVHLLSRAGNVHGTQSTRAHSEWDPRTLTLFAPLESPSQRPQEPPRGPLCANKVHFHFGPTCDALCSLWAFFIPLNVHLEENPRILRQGCLPF